MVRRRGKKVRRDVYSSNIQRLSVYPNPRDASGAHPEIVARLKPGDTVEIRVVSIDEEGRGVGYYKGVKVVVDDVEPGIQVRVRISRVAGDGRIVYGTIDNS